MRSCRYCTGFISCLSLLSHPHANGGNRCDDTGTVVSPEQARPYQAGCSMITLQLMVQHMEFLGWRLELIFTWSWGESSSTLLQLGFSRVPFLDIFPAKNVSYILLYLPTHGSYNPEMRIGGEWRWWYVTVNVAFRLFFFFYPWWNSLVRNNLLLSAVSLQTCWSPLILLPWTSLLLTLCQYPKLVTKIKGKK